MSFPGYRAKRLSRFAVCLLDLLATSGTLLIKGISTSSPTGKWAVAGNGLSPSSSWAGAAALQVRNGRLLIAGSNDNSGAHTHTGQVAFISIASLRERVPSEG